MDHQSVWDKVLNPNEQVKQEFSISFRFRMFWLAFWGIIGLLFLMGGWMKSGIFVIALAAFYYGFYLKVAHAYAFTDNRVLVHNGWLSTGMFSAEYQHINDVIISQPLLDKIFFHAGHIRVATGSSTNVTLRHVEHPYDLKKKLDELRGHR